MLNVVEELHYNRYIIGLSIVNNPIRNSYLKIKYFVWKMMLEPGWKNVADAIIDWLLKLS